MRIYGFRLKFHWDLFLNLHLTISQNWVGQQFSGTKQATRHYLNQCWPSSLKHICDIRGRWVDIDSLLEMFYVVYWHVNICGVWENIAKWTIRIWLKILRVRFQAKVYLKKHAHGFVVLCFVVVIQSFIVNSHEAFIHIHQGCFAGTGAIVRLPKCQWSKRNWYGKISQCMTTTKHSFA